MSVVGDFIKTRLAEIEPRVAALEAELAPLRIELQELRKVRAALEGKVRYGRRREQEPHPDSIQGQALAVLRDAGRPLTALEILGRIHVQFARDHLTRESLAPQLSRLRQAGQLEHNGQKYALPVEAAAQEDQPR